MQIYICEYVKFTCPTEKCAGAVESLQLPEDPTIYGLRFRVYGVRLTGHYMGPIVSPPWPNCNLSVCVLSHRWPGVRASGSWGLGANLSIGTWHMTVGLLG